MRIEDVLQRVQGEFAEMPGLCLTAAQAQRLWGLDRDLCTKLLEALVEANFLAQRRDAEILRRVLAFGTARRVSGNRRAPG